MRATKLLTRIIALAALALAASVAPASAGHPQPASDISKLDYAPQGFFKAGDPVPLGNACKTSDLFTSRRDGKRFNPSGKYNAFDTNVYEVFCLPFRGAGDSSATDELGGGDGSDPGRGFCSGAGTSEPQPGPDAPLSVLAGRCPNHQLEYIDYYEETMRDILGDFGVEMKRYEFENPGSGNTFSGRAINPAAVVPGADHPEETVIIGAHYDQTTEGPASAWDSAEGHAQVIRVAKLMADYWRSTGTRPSATVKFIPWDGEESGTLGSLDYAENNIVPGQEELVRGYWNTDPCAGGYPAFRNGNPANARIPLGIQVARPEEIPGDFDVTRVQAFNARAGAVVEDVFTKLDDTVPVTGGQREVFISIAEAAAAGTQADNGPGGPVVISGERPLAFSSDWANFLAKGVPFFNPGPEVTGPGDEGGAGNPDGIAILHTPNDNIVTLNRMTSPDPTGGTFSAGWMKGMEMCANLLAWGMLREDQGGGQTVNGDVVAYYEALPNEAEVSEAVGFDARGSYEYDSAANRTKVPAGQLEYSWDFGDGSTGTGATPTHKYTVAGVYQSKLTVRDTVSGETDTATLPITVVGAALNGPVLADLPEEDADGAFDLTWTFDEALRPGFSRYRVQEAPDAATPLNDPASDLSKWTPSEPTEPTIQPWQLSDDADGSVRGNVRSSEPRSFYTGVDRADQMPGVGPSSGVSILTLKDPIALAGDAQLSYRSSYANDNNDVSRVEVAAVDGGELDWKSVDSIRTTNFFNIPTDEATYPTGMELRRADLSRFAGKQVHIRFVYALGASQFVNVFRTGWYVDDIRVDTGTYTTIGEPTAKSLPVSGRTAGTYGYRVTAIYEDGVFSRPSDAEVTRVTATTPDPTPSPSPTASPDPTVSPSPTASPDPTVSPSPTASPDPTVSPSPTASPDPTVSPSPTASPDPTVSPSPTASPDPTSTAGPTPTGPGTDPILGPPTPDSPCTASERLRASVGAVRGGGLRFRFNGGRSVRIDVIQQTSGRRLIAPRRVAGFRRGGTFVWDGVSDGGRTVGDGIYVVRFRAPFMTRRIAVLRAGGRFRKLAPLDRGPSCGAITQFAASRSVFGGPEDVPLSVSFRLASAGLVSVDMFRGGQLVRRVSIGSRPAGVPQRLRIDADGLRRGTYRIRLSVAGGPTQTLTVRRL